MSRSIRTLLAVAIAGTVVAIPFGNGAVASPGGCTTSRLTIIPAPAPVGAIYIDDRSTQDPIPGVIDPGAGSGGTWIYEESNGKPNLQHKAGQTSILDDTDVEVCTTTGFTTGAPDTLIY